MGEIERLIYEEDAQTTAEYALVILGAAAVASALIAWAACYAASPRCLQEYPQLLRNCILYKPTITSSIRKAAQLGGVIWGICRDGG